MWINRSAKIEKKFLLEIVHPVTSNKAQSAVALVHPDATTDSKRMETFLSLELHFTSNPPNFNVEGTTAKAEEKWTSRSPNL